MHWEEAIPPSTKNNYWSSKGGVIGFGDLSIVIRDRAGGGEEGGEREGVEIGVERCTYLEDLIDLMRVLEINHFAEVRIPY